MGNFKLTLDDFDSDEFELIAIHTNIKDFKLTFLLNLELQILMAKNENEITIKTVNGIGNFSRFSYNDEKQDVTWELIKNKTHFNSNNNVGLFSVDNISMNLIPELKTTDYLLKIDNTDIGFDSKKIINKISKIKNISTVYKVDLGNLKSINNLIF